MMNAQPFAENRMECLPIERAIMERHDLAHGKRRTNHRQKLTQQ
jgi:hypothetical protein